MVEGLVLNHNLSILAVDRDTNTPLAVVLNGVMEENEALVSRSEVRNILVTWTLEALILSVKLQLNYGLTKIVVYDSHISGSNISNPKQFFLDQRRFKRNYL